MKNILLVTLLLVSSAALAGNSEIGSSTLQDIKTTIMRKFITQANSPGSALNKTIAQINRENADELNSDGIVSKTVRTEDIQVLQTADIEFSNAYRTSQKVGKTCIGKNNSSTFVVMLDTNLGTHDTVEHFPLAFQVEAYSEARKDIVTKGDIRCDDLDADFSEENTTTVIGKFILADISVKEKQK